MDCIAGFLISFVLKVQCASRVREPRAEMLDFNFAQIGQNKGRLSETTVMTYCRYSGNRGIYGRP